MGDANRSDTSQCHSVTRHQRHSITPTSAMPCAICSSATSSTINVAVCQDECHQQLSTLGHLEAECKAAKEETANVKAQLLQLMAEHQSLKAQPTAAEPQNTAVQQVNAEAGEGLTRTCGLCNTGLPKSAFSNAQWKRERDSPKCRTCA